MTYMHGFGPQESSPIGASIGLCKALGPSAWSGSTLQHYLRIKVAACGKFGSGFLGSISRALVFVGRLPDWPQVSGASGSRCFASRRIWVRVVFVQGRQGFEVSIQPPRFGLKVQGFFGLAGWGRARGW